MVASVLVLVHCAPCVGASVQTRLGGDGLFGDMSPGLCPCTWQPSVHVLAAAVREEHATRTRCALGNRASARPAPVSGEACASAEVCGRNTTGSAVRGLVQFMLQRQGRAGSWGWWR